MTPRNLCAMDYATQLRQQLAKARKEASKGYLKRTLEPLGTLEALLSPVKDDRYEEEYEEANSQEERLEAAVSLMVRQGFLEVDGGAGEVPA